MRTVVLRGIYIRRIKLPLLEVFCLILEKSKNGFSINRTLYCLLLFSVYDNKVSVKEGELGLNELRN